MGVEGGVEDNRDSVRTLEKQVKGLGEELKKRDKKIEKAVKEGMSEVFGEIRERDARRLNVIFHRVGETENERATGQERQDWDKSCANIFAALEIGMTEKDVKFCRRVGEKGEGPRPLIVGLYTEVERNKVLRYGRYLEETDFKDVTVGADLTKKQRDEESELKETAEKKNGGLTEEDIAKNLQWTVVGRKGEKSLIKTVQREWVRGGREGRESGERRGRDERWQNKTRSENEHGRIWRDSQEREGEAAEDWAGWE
jgi:hypothetical protein